jgi:hypothetical protein
MRMWRNEVLYQTNVPVRRGDEFYQLVLEENASAPSSAFKVKTFHGFAGNPPVKPENSKTFSTRTLADDSFNETRAKIMANEFHFYDPTVHGPDAPF